MIPTNNELTYSEKLITVTWRSNELEKIVSYFVVG